MPNLYNGVKNALLYEGHFILYRAGKPETLFSKGSPFMQNYSEDTLVEQPTIALFTRLGYQTINAFHEQAGARSILGRETFQEVVLVSRLRDALRRLNAGVSREAIELAIEELARDRSALSRAHANREVCWLLKQGVKVKVRVVESEAGEGGDEIDEVV